MKIYEKTKNFLSFLGDIYFRITNYNYLEKQYKKNESKNLELSGQVGKLKKRAENFFYQYETEVKKAKQIALKNQRLTNLITNLSKQLGGLEESVEELTEQKYFLSEELATTQKNLLDYQQGVTNLPEYKTLLEEKAAFETKVEKLEKQAFGLDNLCGLQKGVINKLQIKLRKYDKDKITQEEDSYEKRAENQDKDQSYIIIGEHSKIVASTLEFREAFNYNDFDKPIKGRHYFNVLKIPEDSPDYINQKQMKEILKNFEEIKLTTTIIDGKGEEKIIRFIKHIPEHYQIGKFNYFYTRVDVYAIGRVERTFGKVLRTLHMMDKPPETTTEFLKQKAINDTKKETEQQKEKILSSPSEESKPRNSWFRKRINKKNKLPKTINKLDGSLKNT